MQVEHVAWIRFASGWAANDQRDVAIGFGVLGQVIIDDKRVASRLHELFTHRAARVGRDVFERRGVGCARYHDDGMLHRALFFQNGLCARYGRVLLTNSHVDADQVFALLVDDGVDSYRRLTRLAVADQQFALAAPDGDHAVNGFDTGLHRGVHRLARNHARSHALDGARLIRNDRPFIVDWLAQWVNHAANQRVTNGNRDHAARRAHFVVFTNMCIIAQDGAAHRFLFEVKGHAHDPGAGKFYQFQILHILQTVDARDTVLHRDYGANAGGFRLAPTKSCDVFLYDGADFVSP